MTTTVKMKHALVLLLLLLVTFLAACQTSTTITTTSGSQSTTTTTISGSNTTQTTTSGTSITTTQTTKPVPNMMGQEFVIMVNNASTTDPRRPTYTGSWKTEKIAAIAAVEAKYNVKVVYRTYPADAVWGGGRERFIITNSLNNTPQAHIYEMPSYSIAVLAEGGAILPLDSLIEKYGHPGYWPEKAAFGQVLGQQYAYDDAYPLAGQGIFYNITLLEELLGEGKGTLPSELWLRGEWTWEAFETMANQLLPGISARGVDGAAVIGGRPYNWAYVMLGANGVHVVNTELRSELATQPAIDTLLFLNKLVSIPGMWEYSSAALSNATVPQFKGGNVAFHNGEPYWIYDSTKWLGYTFEMGFVPYPTGPNTNPDLSNYFINDVYGKTSYVVSSSYSLDKVPPGYENIAFHEETIFRIWADLQYFPPIDPLTGRVSTNEIVEEWIFNTLELYYSDRGNNASIEAHRSIMFRSYPDYFYSLYWARSQDPSKSFMLDLQHAILTGNVRDQMIDLVQRIHQEFLDTYKNLGLTPGHYR